MSDVVSELNQRGQVARVGTLRARGCSDAAIAAALASGAVVLRPRRGWLASRHADRDQLRAIAIGGPIGCASALRRFGVWSGTDDRLHLLVPERRRDLRRQRRRLAETSPVCGIRRSPSATAVACALRLASYAAPRIHWSREFAPAEPSTGSSRRTPPSRRPCAASMLSMRAQRSTPRSMSACSRGVEKSTRSWRRYQEQARHSSIGFTGIPESGVESLFIGRMSAGGVRGRPQVDFAGFGRYDGLIDGCVLFEIDGRGFHSGAGGSSRTVIER